MQKLAEEFGPIDIYLFDQLLRGRVPQGGVVFDAGCGGGRNLIYLLRQGYQVFGLDEDPQAIAAVREMAQALAPGLPATNFVVSGLEALSESDQVGPFTPALADLVICSAVLHFARDEAQFGQMLRGCWRIVRPGGLLFARLSSTIGLEQALTPLGGRRYRLPGGPEWFLVDAPYLRQWQRDLGADLADPIKTTVVEDQRAMTTWVLQKPA